MTKELVILGGEGGGAIVANAAAAAIASGAGFTIKGFLNDHIAKGEAIHGLPVLGRIEDWHHLPENSVFIPALHNFKVMHARLEKIRSLGIPPGRWQSVIHPFCSVAKSATVGYGSYIGPFAVIEPGVSVGNFACIRSGACLSHDVHFGEFVFAGANSTIAGRSRIGEGTHVGPNSVVRDDLSIANFTTIGIGAVVVRSTESSAVLSGNPARSIPRRF